MMQLRNEMMELESLKRDLELQNQGNSSSLTLKLNQALDDNNRLEEQVQELKRRLSRLEAERLEETAKISQVETERFRLLQELR